MNYKTRVIALPGKCWIYSDREYILHTSNELHFPTVKDEYECVLKENGIPYKKRNPIFQQIEYWNPSLYKEEEVTAPLFAFVRADNSFYYTERSYTGKFPTTETIEKAWEIKETVDKLIEEYKWQKEMIAFAHRCNVRLNGEVAVGIEISNLEASRFENQFVFKYKGERIMYIRFLVNLNTSYIVLINMDKVESGSVITMKVPKGKEGLFVGESGCRVKYLSKILRVRRINVVS